MSRRSRFKGATTQAMRKIYILSIALLLASHYAHAQSAFELLFGEDEKYKDVVVDKVLTVDTFQLIDGQRIRLIGLRGPDLPQKEKQEREAKGEMGFVMERGDQYIDPTEKIEETALEFVQKLIEGVHVRLEFDVNKKSDDHKTLAYVYLVENGTFVNAEILRQGFASLSIQPPNTKYTELLREAYREAREEFRGLHGQ